MTELFDLELVYNDKSSLNNYWNPKSTDASIRFLEKVNSINVFIGANNSGKSRFLRNLMSSNELVGVKVAQYLLKKIDKYNKAVEEMDLEIKLPQGPINLLTQFSSDVEKYKYNQNEVFRLSKINQHSILREMVNEVNDSKLLVDKMFLVFNYHKIHPREIRFTNDLYINGNRNNNSYLLKTELIKIKLIKSLIDEIEILIKENKTFNGNRIYIPTLRTAHSLFRLKPLENPENPEDNLKATKIRDDIFLDTIRNNYKTLNNQIEIFSGLNLYNEIVNVRNSIKEERVKFHNFEDFLSFNFFEGEDVDIVAKFNINNKDKGIDDDDLIQVYIGGKSRKLHNLGDGVQSLIILMYKIFLAEKDSVIFIDEPELNLHPGYQRLFLEQLTRNEDLLKKNLTYFIVTHSNHFLDLTLEENNVSIYAFDSNEKRDKFFIRNVNAGDNSLLQDLGVNNSSVFLANSSIWVEGVSDRNFIKAFLIAYCKNEKKKLPREDIDFAFFEYAGSNLVHYDFKNTNSNNYKEGESLITSYALNNKIFLLSDLDTKKEAKHKNLQTISENIDNFEYRTTSPYRELENLLSNDIWEKVLLDFCNKKDIKDNEDNVQKRIVKALAKVNSVNYISEYIGEFLFVLKEEITELNKIWEENSSGEPATFRPKAELSQLILSKVIKEEIIWEDFAKNETIVDLTESIYNFIMNSKN